MKTLKSTFCTMILAFTGGIALAFSSSTAWYTGYNAHGIPSIQETERPIECDMLHSSIICTITIINPLIGELESAVLFEEPQLLHVLRKVW